MAFISGGHTNLTVNRMKSENEIACAINVRLMFMFEYPRGRRQNERAGDAVELLGDDGKQGIAERKQHRDAEADDERGVDQAQQQEYFRL